METNASVQLVIHVLKGLSVDETTMKHIITEVGHEKLMTTTKMPDAVKFSLVEHIVTRINHVGDNIIQDYDLDIDYSKTVNASNFELDERELENAIELAIDETFGCDE